MLPLGQYNHPTTKIRKISGRLDAHTNLQVEQFISEAEQGRCDHVILNFSEITVIDLGGIGQLFVWYHNLKAHRIRLSIVNPQPLVRVVLEASHLLELIPIYQSIPEAIGGVSRPSFSLG